jgi:gas vesicle protein
MNKTLLAIAVSTLMATSLAARAETALPANTFIAAEAPVQYLAKDRLIGAKIKGPDGKIIGDIEDIILSGDHQVVGVVMGTGGFFGMFEKKVGVEIGAIQFDVTDGKIGATLPSATGDVLAAAPAFERNSPKKSLFERAVEKGQEIRDKTGASTKDAYESAKEKAGPAVEKAKEAAKEAVEKAKEVSKEAVDKAKEVTKEAIDKAKEAVDKAQDAAKTATEPAPSTEPAPAEAPKP